jgi:spermidine/putrescine-binding protein
VGYFISSKAITKMLAAVIAVIVVAAGIGGVYYYTIVNQSTPYLTVSTWGGVYKEAWDLIIPDFEKEYGIQVKLHMQSGSGETATRILAENASPSIDLYWGSGYGSERVCAANLGVNITYEKVPNLEFLADVSLANLPKYFMTTLDYYGWMIYPDIIPVDHAFNGSWRWFFDAAQKGKIAIPPHTWASFYSWIFRVNGNYTDWEGGIEFLKGLVQNKAIKFEYSTHMELISAFQDKEIWAGFGTFSDCMDANKEGIPIVAVKDFVDAPIGAYMGETMQVIKSGKEDMAFKLLNYLLKRYARDVAIPPRSLSMPSTFSVTKTRISVERKMSPDAARTVGSKEKYVHERRTTGRV